MECIGDKEETILMCLELWYQVENNRKFNQLDAKLSYLYMYDSIQ